MAGVDVGKDTDARRFAEELERLIPKYRGDWNQRNAIQATNVVFGRLDLKKGHLDEAKRPLLNAARCPGSPQMKTFGPNLSLARDPLRKREKNVVLEYLEYAESFGGCMMEPSMSG